eukprot:TRINITY_DN18584_c0_g1_i2.p1 TRINITY_DN18584_c0_g1~~TRINITY_DN18584_c0_g1_i2.p1  ORF type:complete len:108 (-),score=8.40 TRINITY_DN18584_c0_g1_i2:40-363(-)
MLRSLCYNLRSQLPQTRFKSRVLYKRMSQGKPSPIYKDSELQLLPCILKDELSPQEIEELWENYNDPVSYKLDRQAWIDAEKPNNRNPFMRVYCNGVLTDEKIPEDI